jgi:hypothetical protein
VAAALFDVTLMSSIASCMGEEEEQQQQHYFQGFALMISGVAVVHYQ